MCASTESSEAERAERLARLRDLAPLILKAVPGSAIAADQPYRIADLAIDFREDVPPLDYAAVGRIVEVFSATAHRRRSLHSRQRLVRRL